MSFNDYLKAQGKSQSTVTYYEYCIADFIHWLESKQLAPEQATGPDIMNYLEYLKAKGQNSQTRSVRLNAINHLFDHSLSEGACEHHPSRHIKLRGRQQNKLYPVLTREQLESIYVNYTIPEENDARSNRNWFRSYLLGKRRNKVILGLMIWQGLTTAEVHHLQVRDLNLRAGTVYVRGGRKSNERTLDLKPGQIMDLMEYQLQVRPEILTYYTKPVEDLFLSLPVSGGKTAINSGGIWKRLSAEIREQHPWFINFKQVRTSVIVAWLKHHNLRQVQHMAGHRFVSSTEKYLLHEIEDLQADIDRFHPMG